MNNYKKQQQIDFANKIAALAEELQLNNNQDTISAVAWFLGPKAENKDLLKALIDKAVDSQVNTRESYQPDDPPIQLDKETDESYKKSVELLHNTLEHLLTKLQSSIPLASYRNQSHMYWDLTLPGVAGYFAAMLYNQNNVAAEASPVTTLLEIIVGESLCRMLGFHVPKKMHADDKKIRAWGHITCDGSVANGESMWAARNLKFLPVALKVAIQFEESLKQAREVSVKTCEGTRSLLLDLTNWQLLNLPVDEVLGLVERIEHSTSVKAKDLRSAIDKYSVQNIGLVEVYRRYIDHDFEALPIVCVPSTAHYSWPKTAALIGLGTHAVKMIPVDLDARMNTVYLRQVLDECLQKQRPVLQVVAVIGSTAESAVDPLCEIVKIRNEYRQLGLEFVIHVDGAWGGYFTSMLRTADGFGVDPASNIDLYADEYLSPYVKQQYKVIDQVDSITLDPHKSGFIPYPAGSLCYRNGAMRDLIAYKSPVVFHGGVDVTVGPYGIEGSKPGAAAAAVYLSHKLIPLNRDGYGRLLGRCIFNNKLFYANLITMPLDSELITVTPLRRLPSEQAEKSENEIKKEKQFIKQHIVARRTDELIDYLFANEKKSAEQKRARKIFDAIGSDLSIIAYVFNFKTSKGINKDLSLMNQLNDAIFHKLSLHPTLDGKLPNAEMFVTSSSFNEQAYGKAFMKTYATRTGVKYHADMQMSFLISTTQNPWLSTTSVSKDCTGNFIINLMKILKNTAEKQAKKIIENL